MPKFMITGDTKLSKYVPTKTFIRKPYVFLTNANAIKSKPKEPQRNSKIIKVTLV